MRQLRQFGVVVLLVATKIFWWPVLKLLKLFDFKILVLLQPGSNSDIVAYIPLWLSRKIEQPFIAGLITSKTSLGLIVAIPLSIRKMVKSKKLTEEMKDFLVDTAKEIGAKKIAMVGQIPAVFEKHGILSGDILVDGTFGTLFSIKETFLMVLEREVITMPKITILGVGKIGSSLLKLLEDDGFICQGIDLGDISKKGKQKFLKGSSIIINLLPRGNMIEQYEKYFSDDVIVVDDTHPMMKNKAYTVYKVAVSSNDIRFLPKLPGYPNDMIPGCIVEALVLSKFGDINNFVEFTKKAKKMGLFAPLKKINEFT